MAGHVHIFALLFCVLLGSISGCLVDGTLADSNSGPREAFHQWIEIIETRDFAGMWKKLPMTAKERFSYSWDEEKDQLARSSEEFKQGFIKRYGYSGWAEIKNEDARGFFIRSMSVNDDGKFPKKYSILKESTIENFEYLNNGNACIITFKGPQGNVLPLKMKFQKEGEDWQVIRMP